MLPKLKAIASVDGLIASASAVFATVTIGPALPPSHLRLHDRLNATWRRGLDHCTFVLERGCPHGDTGLGSSPFLIGLSARFPGWHRAWQSGLGCSGQPMGHQFHFAGRRRGAHYRRGYGLLFSPCAAAIRWI
jgi:hypothetical protein